MKIEELITESQVTDEGVLSALGTGVGAIGKGLGAISGAYQGAKDQFNKGHAAARAHVGGHMPAKPKDTSARDAEFQKLTGKPAPGAQPAQGAAPAGGANPQDLAAQIKAKEAELADLKNQQKQAQKQPPQDLAPPPQSQPGIGSASNGNNAAATATEPAQTGATAPTNTASKQPAPGERVEPTMDPAATPQPNAAPAPTQGADNQVAQQSGAATPPPTGGKLTPQQIAAKKAEIQGKRAAGQTTASQTGSGFKDYVGGSQNKLTTNPDGSTSMKKLQRESVDFYSRFLGQKL
jgi:hypothetical protein